MLYTYIIQTNAYLILAMRTPASLYVFGRVCLTKLVRSLPAISVRYTGSRRPPVIVGNGLINFNQEMYEDVDKFGDVTQNAINTKMLKLFKTILN